jgi:hypothetical protein
LNTLSVKLNGVLGELETLLDEGGQLADATTLLTKNVLGVGGTDDDPIQRKKNSGFSKTSCENKKRIAMSK